jgi:hypothetical protein
MQQGQAEIDSNTYKEVIINRMNTNYLELLVSYRFGFFLSSVEGREVEQVPAYRTPLIRLSSLTS